MRLKSKEEIEILKIGGAKHAQILRELAAMVVPGVSTHDLEDKAQELIGREGGKAAFLGYTPRGAKRPFPAALCVSVNDEIVHGIPNENSKELKEGDIVSLDLGFVYKGLITDAAVTVAVGKVDSESERLLRVTKEALDAGVREAKNGKYIGDIGRAVTEVVDRSGFSLAEDLCGHGVGYEVHEDPYVPNFGGVDEGEKLVPGLVIAIEPMVNIGGEGIKFSKDGYTILTKDGSRSAHFEHTVAITEEGHIILTL